MSHSSSRSNPLPQPHFIKLPQSSDANKVAFTLENVFSKEECRELVVKTEERGYIPALVNVGGGQEVVMQDVRNNDRCIIDDVGLATTIFERVKHTIPQVFKGRQVISLNERLRFLRYTVGQKFEPHMDGTYVRPNGETSMITLQLYLNEGCEGGSTAFLDWNEKNFVEVVPKIGQELIFQHDILHCGAKVTKGTKYVMRTDIMYTK